jgi:hypothetical protein
MKKDTGKPWVMRRGRQWINHTHWSERVDGWWFFGYRMWMPRLRYFPIAVWWWLRGEGNNYFYIKKRRERYGIEL